MESEEIFAELLRTSPPDPFAVRHTRPRRATRARPRPKVPFGAEEAFLGAFSGLFPAVAVYGVIKLGPNIVSTVIMAGSLIVLGLLALFYGVYVWFSFVPKKCPRCHRQQTDAKRDSWCWKCGLLVRRPAFRKELQRWSSSHDLRTLLCSEDTTIRGVAVIICAMMQDQVAEILFQPAECDYRMVVVHNGLEFDLEPPPAYMHRKIAVAARGMWHGELLDSSPLDAVQTVYFDDLYAAVQLNITPTPAGEVLRFQFSYPHENLVESPIPQPAAIVS